jgi:hypothetical protein
MRWCPIWSNGWCLGCNNPLVSSDSSLLYALHGTIWYGHSAAMCLWWWMMASRFLGVFILWEVDHLSSPRFLGFFISQIPAKQIIRRWNKLSCKGHFRTIGMWGEWGCSSTVAILVSICCTLEHLS